MLVYEKNNKLNINFDNEISENPDLQISKDGDKTEVLIDGQPGGGSGGAFVVHNDGGTLDKTWEEIYNAMDAGNISVIRSEFMNSIVFEFISSAAINNKVGVGTVFAVSTMNKYSYETDSRSGYPVYVDA